MRKCPKLGDRVFYRSPEDTYASWRSDGLTGTVRAIYPSYVYDDERDQPTNTLEPESEWAVGVEVDQVPDGWPYPHTNRFAPEVKRLKRL